MIEKACLSCGRVFYISQSWYASKRKFCSYSCRKGRYNSFYGRHHSEETKKRIGKANSRLRPQWFKDKISGAQKGRKHSEETKRKIKQWNVEFWGSKRSKSARKKISLKVKERLKTHPHPCCGKKRPDISKLMKERWQDPKFAKTQLANLSKWYHDPARISKVLEGLMRRPTSLEKRFIRICDKHRLPFKYCGNGSLMIGYKNPDFYESNGRKLVIEVANRYHHPNPWAQKRIIYFQKYGYNCAIFFEDELEDEERVVERLRCL